MRDISDHVVSRLESANPTYTGWLRQAQDYVASQGDSPDNDEDLHWSYYGFHVEDDDFYGAVSPICTGREIEDNITELPRCKVPGVAVDLDHLCSNVADHQEFYSCFTGGTAVTLDPHALSTNEQLQNTLVHELAHVYTMSPVEMTTDVGEIRSRWPRRGYISWPTIARTVPCSATNV